MRGCLFTLLLGGVVIALVVVVGLPQVAAGMLTGALTAAGLEADDTTVTVSSEPPTDLLGLHADRVRVRATDATFRGLAIGSLDVELRGVAILDRTAAEVDGRLADVIVDDIGGRSVTLDEISITGSGEAIAATTELAGDDAESLIADGVEARLGARPREVSLLAPNRLRVDLGVGPALEGTLDVTPAGDLVVLVPGIPAGAGEILLLRGGQDLPIRLDGLVVTPEGDLRLSGGLAIAILG